MFKTESTQAGLEELSVEVWSVSMHCQENSVASGRARKGAFGDFHVGSEEVRLLCISGHRHFAPTRALWKLPMSLQRARVVLLYLMSVESYIT